MIPSFLVKRNFNKIYAHRYNHVPTVNNVSLIRGERYSLDSNIDGTAMLIIIIGYVVVTKVFRIGIS
mgnify:CR=1 FL=1